MQVLKIIAACKTLLLQGSPPKYPSIICSWTSFDPLLNIIEKRLRPKSIYLLLNLGLGSKTVIGFVANIFFFQVILHYYKYLLKLAHLCIP